MNKLRAYLAKMKEQRVNAELRKYPLALGVSDRGILLARHNIKISP